MTGAGYSRKNFHGSMHPEKFQTTLYISIYFRKLGLNSSKTVGRLAIGLDQSHLLLAKFVNRTYQAQSWQFATRKVRCFPVAGECRRTNKLAASPVANFLQSFAVSNQHVNPETVLPGTAGPSTQTQGVGDVVEVKNAIAAAAKPSIGTIHDRRGTGVSS